MSDKRVLFCVPWRNCLGILLQIIDWKGEFMGNVARLASAVCITLLVGCVTNSRVITDPPGLHVAINNVDFGKSPCDIQSVGTTFGQYRLRLTDDGGKVVHEQDLPKNVRIWGIFWPPYGIFYNLFEFHPQYTVVKTRTSTGDVLWAVTTH